MLSFITYFEKCTKINTDKLLKILLSTLKYLYFTYNPINTLMNHFNKYNEKYLVLIPIKKTVICK